MARDIIKSADALGSIGQFWQELAKGALSMPPTVTAIITIGAVVSIAITAGYSIDCVQEEADGSKRIFSFHASCAETV